MKKYFLMALFASAPFAYQTSDPAKPQPVSDNPAEEFTTAATMDVTIGEAIRAGEIPGAVVVVGHKGRVVFQKAYGQRALFPQVEPMTLDTIFDVASLTKSSRPPQRLPSSWKKGRFASTSGSHITSRSTRMERAK
jgi:CubicO group peptidase (beta-lactamase class C family)